MPNWTILPTDGGFSWRVWEGEAEERGHATTKETAMQEIQDACRRVGTLDSYEPPDPIETRLQQAQTLLRDSFHTVDQEAADSCVRQAIEHIEYVLGEL